MTFIDFGEHFSIFQNIYSYKLLFVNIDLYSFIEKTMLLRITLHTYEHVFQHLSLDSCFQPSYIHNRSLYRNILLNIYLNKSFIFILLNLKYFIFKKFLVKMQYFVCMYHILVCIILQRDEILRNLGFDCQTGFKKYIDSENI